MRVGILGGGESGVGAALLARKLNYNVFVSDAGQLHDRYRDELKSNNIPFEESGHTLDRLKKSDIVVKSPGIPGTATVIRELRGFGVPIISELDLAFRHCHGNVLAVTGSNGKTTTASLCHHILRSSAVDSVLCGNVGESFARHVARGENDWYVVEASSFQLEDSVDFHPRIAIILNITPDHLDRYEGDIEKYAEAKFRITRQMVVQDLLIYNLTDNIVRGLVEAMDHTIGLKPIGEDDEMAFRLGSGLMGKHNAFNAKCAIAAARWIGVYEDEIQKALMSFTKPAHRLEYIAELNDVEYINDSKATNVDAVYYALDAMTRPVIWIAGGQDKGNDYSQLFALAESKVKALICLGIENEKLKAAFSAKVKTTKETTDVSEAVNMAASIASPGDVVLLSPACASFDLFKNYMERGDLFKKAVLSLKQ